MSTSNDFVAYAYTSTTDRNSCTIYRFTTRWLRSSIQGSTTAILSSSGYQLTCSDVFGLCSTLRSSCVPVLSLVVTISSQTLSQLFSGCVYLVERVEFTAAVMAFRPLRGPAPL